MDNANVKKDTTSHNAIIEAYSSTGAWLSAMVHFKNAKKDGLTTIETYNLVMKGFANNGAWDRCSPFIEEMKDDGMKPDIETYGNAIRACRLLGKWKEAEAWFHQLQNDGIQLNKSIIKEMIVVYTKAEEYERTLKLLNKIKIDTT
eukprot:UN04739